ncbi:MAG: major facilitator superfamily 1 [Bacteroidetes bacterium]|nr:major facilitator superfamily 1 [Bacteroidota bacterium]
MDGALFAFAISLVSVQTVLPIFVRDMGGGNVAVGLIPVIYTLGFNFPQWLIAGYAQRQVHLKPLLLRTAIGQRLPWLLLAAATYWVVANVGSETAIPVFFVLLALAAIGGSLNLPVWFDLIAFLTPVRRRGRLFGYRSILGAGFGLAGGGIVTFVLQRVPYPGGYALLFLLCFLVMMVSYMFLVSLRENRHADPVPGFEKGRVRLSPRQVLRTAGNYRNYLVADALQTSASAGIAFYAVDATARFSLPSSYAGIFTIIMMAGNIIGSALFGALADRRGHRLNLLVAAAATGVGSVTALLAPSVEVYAIAFVTASLTLSLLMISRLPFLAELSPEAERPSRVAIASMLTSPFVLTGLLAGWVASTYGFVPVFVASAGIALIAFLWLLFMVDEPRTGTGHAAPAAG